jgi:hypothetical protein
MIASGCAILRILSRDIDAYSDKDDVKYVIRHLHRSMPSLFDEDYTKPLLYNDSVLMLMNAIIEREKSLEAIEYYASLPPDPEALEAADRIDAVIAVVFGDSDPVDLESDFKNSDNF